MILKKTSFLKKGITTMEVILALGIFSTIIYLSSASFINFQKSTLLSDNAWKLGSVLREAQQRSASGETLDNKQLKFGILFYSDYYLEFATSSDFTAREEDFDLQTNLPSSLEFSFINLPDSCLMANDCIIYSSITGMPSGNGFVKLKNLTDNSQKTISINQEGKVSF